MKHIKPPVENLKGDTYTSDVDIWFKTWLADSQSPLKQPVRGSTILYFLLMIPLVLACIFITCLYIFGTILWVLPIITKFIFWLKSLI